MLEANPLFNPEFNKADAAAAALFPTVPQEYLDDGPPEDPNEFIPEIAPPYKSEVTAE